MAAWMAAMRVWGQRYLRALAYVFNVYTLLLSVVSCAAVHICLRFGFSYDLEFSLIGLGLVFPVTFAIGQQFARREKALHMLAELKASVLALYWQHRDWAQDEGYPDSLGDDKHQWAKQVAQVLTDFLVSIELFIASDDVYESMGEMRVAATRGSTWATFFNILHLRHYAHCTQYARTLQEITGALPSNRHLQRAYACLSRLSVMNEYLTVKAKYGRGGEGGLSRTAQLLRFLVTQMEQLRLIKVYRTPALLRYSCTLLVYLGSVALAPYFVHKAVCRRTPGWPGDTCCVAPYVMACLYVMITMLLLNVQAAGENPFDMRVGLDDVFLELSREFQEAIHNPVQLPPMKDSGKCFLPKCGTSAPWASKLGSDLLDTTGADSDQMAATAPSSAAATFGVEGLPVVLGATTLVDWEMMECGEAAGPAAQGLATGKSSAGP